MLTIYIDVSTVSVINSNKNQSKLTTTFFFLVFKGGCIIGYTMLSKKWKILKTFYENVFIDNKYNIRIRWVSNKVKQLFKLKTRNLHASCKIYEGVCSCQD